MFTYFLLLLLPASPPPQIGLVIGTGDNTLIGQVATLATATKSGETTFECEVRHFVWIVSGISITMAVIVFIVGVARGLNVLDVLINGFLIIIVANIPQGIPSTVVSLLTIAAR